MKCMYFTKPKTLTERCMKWLYHHCTNLVIVFCHKEAYEETEFVKFCNTHDIKILDHDEIEYYIRQNPGLDVIISNIYPRKIENHLLALADKAAFNIHPAPLPQYRGVFGYNFAMLNKDMEYGVTAHKLSERFDEGDIIEVDYFSYDCGHGWLDELVPLAEEHMYQLLTKIMTKLLNGEQLSYYSQGKGCYYSQSDFEKAKKIKPEDKKEQIDQKIRSFWYPPFEGAYVELDGQKYALINEEIMNRISPSANPVLGEANNEDSHY